MSVTLIAAPRSGAGKTTVTLGILRALQRKGIPIRSAKIGPDYIDPAFHAAATGRDCLNLDPWAMPLNRLESLMAGDGPLLIEGAMGLFDGAGSTREGSASHLAGLFDLPVVLVLDCAGASTGIAAEVLGMMAFDPDLRITGLILNRVGSDRHAALLRSALARPAAGRDLPPVIGVLPRDTSLAHPGRHLGLVQAAERADLDDWLRRVADACDAGIDLDALFGAPISMRPVPAPVMAPLGQRIAVARDQAFAFAYPHILNEWRRMGAEILPFSPLNDDPVPPGDAVYLPGGYPELHAGRLAANTTFLDSLRDAAHSATVYGECGGYMVLGDGLTDADGRRHAMAGLLRLETSFAARRLHLGYRLIRALGGPFKGHYTGHEFHYSTQTKTQGAPLFETWDSARAPLGPVGLRHGPVCGSYLHLIDRADHRLDHFPPLDAPAQQA